jgi:hypothetical protein
MSVSHGHGSGDSENNSASWLPNSIARYPQRPSVPNMEGGLIFSTKSQASIHNGILPINFLLNFPDQLQQTASA